MTPRRAGWLAGLVVFATVGALEWVVTIDRGGPESGDTMGGNGFALGAALRVIILATATGGLVASIAASKRGRRAAAFAAISAYLVVGLWTWWQSANSPAAPGEDPGRYALGLVTTFVTVGTAFALTAALIAWWIVRNAVGRDGPERVLALETASLHGSRNRWGAAMRAELASIDDPAQRRSFARSAAAAAFRHGTGRWPVILAAFAGIGAGVVVFCAARISFDRPRDRGIISEPLMGLVVVILVSAVVAGTLIGRSFRAGVETAVLAWIAVYICTIAVEIPQALAWYHEEGILLLDGEGAAGAGVDATAAALQPISHYAFIFVSVSQLVIAVLAAALGAGILRIAQQRTRTPDAAAQ